MPGALRRLCWLFAALVFAAAPAAAEPLPAHDLTAADVEAWSDGLIELGLERGDIAGAAVVVVKDGQVLFSKGYGVADVKTGRRVDPAETLFRPGSSSKLFTWTSVMQLVEQGKLDLDADVNTYLDFKIPPYEGKPVTLRNLMTHTAGFEERVRDFFVRDPRNLLPMGEALKSAMPARVRTPGSAPAYSNWGAGLAAYIVQRVSGERFDRYVDNHIFRPLGMTSTSMAQPLPAPLMARMSKGYASAASGQEQWYEYAQWPGAGAAAMTALDMSKFMIAHLNAGAPLLKPETAALMHRQAYSAGARAGANGMALGFFNETRNGVPAIGHGGATIAFKTEMRMIPQAKTGFVLMLNGPGKDGVAWPIQSRFGDGFLQRYFPGEAEAPLTTTTTALAHGQAVSGNYVSSRSVWSHWFKLAQLFGQSTAMVDDKGVLTVSSITDIGDQPRRFREVGPYVWREIGGDQRLTAVRNADGSVKYLAGDFDQTSVLLPAPASEDKDLVMPLLMASLAVLALTVVLWPVAAVVRRNLGQRPEPADRRASLVVHLTALFHVLFFGGWMFLFGSFVALIDQLNRSMDPKLRLLQVVGLLAAIGTAFVIVHAIRLWPRKDRGLWVKLGTTAIALSGVVMIFVDVVFRLLWPALG